MEDQFNKYKEDKNQRFKVKIKELQDLYEGKLEKERGHNKSLEIKLAEYKTLLQVMTDQEKKLQQKEKK
eukprot:CAMPEP_0170552514 /NCGR_PEP_ID=MMETSP0211-20121228/10385_1 /TAXON_ID=311385 /ORGANISM="Pseudokeronopsis sp., Strain OXSARD2" /LENGTH=68 /DNA_ID=CAMNT_0010860263 /DNA_START=441 /DNA_END=647 /DNA_ORIENTATION=+